MCSLADRERIEQIRQRQQHAAQWHDKIRNFKDYENINFLLDLLVSQGERRQQEHDEKHDDFARGETTGDSQSSRTASKGEGS